MYTCSTQEPDNYVRVSARTGKRHDCQSKQNLIKPELLHKRRLMYKYIGLIRELRDVFVTVLAITVLCYVIAALAT